MTSKQRNYVKLISMCESTLGVSYFNRFFDMQSGPKAGFYASYAFITLIYIYAYQDD